MYSQAYNNLNPLYHINSGMNVIVLWGGTNDMFNAGQSASTTYSSLKAFSEHERALGWKVIVGTTISRATEDYRKDVYNSMIRANWPEFADGIADFAANPNIGPNGSYASTTWFQGDQTHLTDLGYALVGSIAQTAITNFVNDHNKDFVNGTFLGNLNVGTTTDATTSSARLFIQGTSTQNLLTIASSTGSILFTVLANGNVGIGTSTPFDALNIYNNTNGGVTAMVQNNNNGASAFALVQTQSDGAAIDVQSNSSGKSNSDGVLQILMT